MSTGDDEQLAAEQAPWDEAFRRNFLNAEWPTTLPPSAANSNTPSAPITPVFADGRMAVSGFPPLPSQEYPPMSGHLLPSNAPLIAQASTAAAAPISLHETALRFQSHIAQTFPWQEGYLEAPPFDPSQEYGYVASASSSAPTEMTTQTLPARAIHTSNPWEVVPIHPPPPPTASRPPGPERSRKSRTQRTDPLAVPQGSKARQAKRAAACWRCRKYRKPCDDEHICTSCQVGNFRVWPPALGCRRDNLEGFALAIIPPSTEDLLRTLPSGLEPRPSWRLSVSSKSLAREDLFSDPASDSWSPLAVKVHATGLFGMELVDLLNIVNAYQTRQKTKNPVIEATCTLFSASCDYYNVFVVSAGNQDVTPPRENIAATIQEIRTSMARSLSLFLSLCVSSKRADWFPSVLSFAIFVASVAMFMDAAVAMPAAARTELWEDVTSFCLGLRAQLYPTALDLLRIRANNDKQMAPLKLNCWNWIPEKVTTANIPTPPPGTEPATTQSVSPTIDRSKMHSGANTSRLVHLPYDQPTPPDDEHMDQSLPLPRIGRNPDGMRLVGNDEAAFDGFAALQTWLNANEHVLKQGKILFSNDPFTSPTVAAVCTLAPIFGVR